MYAAELPSNYPGYAGILGQTELLWESKGISAPPTGSMHSTLICVEGVSMPAAYQATTDGAGPRIWRPETGTDMTALTPFITANLVMGIRDLGKGIRHLQLGISNFRTKRADGCNGTPITIGRPWSNFNNFGSKNQAEYFNAMNVRILCKGAVALSHEVIVKDIGDDEFILPMPDAKKNMSFYQEPAYLIGNTCLLSARNTSKQWKVTSD